MPAIRTKYLLASLCAASGAAAAALPQQEFTQIEATDTTVLITTTADVATGFTQVPADAISDFESVASAAVSSASAIGEASVTAATGGVVSIASASSGFAVPTITQPSTATPPASSAAAAASSSRIALAQEAKSEVSNVRAFNALLTVDGDGQELLEGDELRERVVFDFGQRAAVSGEGGRNVQANGANFPILINENLAVAAFFLNPCGMNSPHTHPRASEFVTVVQGSVQTGFMLENGFLANSGEGRQTTQISTTLEPFQGTVFPIGSIHFQFNDNCEPASFISSFNSADPGTSQIAQNFFFQDDQIVNITLGDVQSIDGSNIEEFRTSIPANLVQAVDSCLARCNGDDDDDDN